MSKKYVINIFECAQMVEQIGVNDKGEAVVCSTLVENLEELNSDYINEHFGSLQDDAYNKGYAQCRDDYGDALKHAKDTAYKKGLEDGKVVSNKGCEGCKYQANRELTCPCSECANNYKNQWTAKQTDDKIEVGDEVADKDGDKTIVTNIHGDLFDGLCSDGSTMTDLFLDDNRKTGRHFDIASILEDMRND